MDDQTNKEEDKGQPALDAFTELVESEEAQVMIGNSHEAEATHLVLPTSLVFQTQTVNVAHLS
jgi:hypothetical protein